MSDLTGRTLGKYELTERLGRGGMADVYKAIQRGMERFVAVKVMHGHLAESEDFVVRFKREAQSVGNLRHPHIVQVIDFDVEGDVYYMVMEYIKGGTLKTYIQQKGALSVDESLRITSYLSDALEYAHQNGMIHRDIKPANVMFTDNSFSHPVLTDFGIARILGQSGITMSGAFIGTPAYMSPESGRGTKVDERSDIYSMGVMLYEMVTGNVPFDADTPFAIVMKHINDPLPSPRQFNVHLPQALELVVLKSLAKDPNERYENAKALRIAANQAREDAQNETPTADSRTFDTAVGGKPPTEMPTYIPDIHSAKELPTAGPQNLPRVPDTLAKEQTQPPTPIAKPKIPVAWIGGGLVALVIMAIAGVLLFGGGDDNGGEDDNGNPTEAIEAGLSDNPTEPADVTPLPTSDVESTEAPTDAPTEETQAGGGASTEQPTEEGPQPTRFAGVVATENPDQPPPGTAPTEEATQAPTVDLSAPSGGGGPTDPPENATDEASAEPTAEVTSEVTPVVVAENPNPEGERYVAFLPDDDPAIIALANAIYETDLNQGIETSLELTETGLATYPGNPVLLLLRAELLVRFNRYEEALADAEQAVAEYPDHPAGYLALANYFYQSPDYDYEKAFENVTKAHDLAPENPTVAFAYAVALENVSSDEAIAQYNLAEQLGAPLTDVLYRRSNLYWQTGNHAGVVADLGRLLPLDEERGTRLSLAGAYLLTGQPDEAMRVTEEGFEFYDADPNYYANAAYVAHSAGDGEQSIEWANTALAFDGNMTGARYVLGLVAFSNEDYEGALEYYQQVADAENQDYWYPFLNPTYDRHLPTDQARAEREIGDTDAAIAHYQVSIDEICCWWSTPLLERAELYIGIEMPYEAAADFIEAYRRSGENLDTQTVVLNTLLEAPLDVINAALEEWLYWDNNADMTKLLADRALEKYPDTPSFLFWRAETYLYWEDYDAARQDAEAARDLSPDEYYGYLALAHYHRRTEQDSDAQMLTTAQQALERAPDDAFVLLEYARILNDADLGAEVIDAYYNAEDAGAYLPTVLEERGDYASQIGDYSQAIEDYTRLLELELTDTDNVLSLLRAYLHDDDPEAALAAALQYQEMNLSEEGTASYYPDLAFVAWKAEDYDQTRAFLDLVNENYRTAPKVILMNGLLLHSAGDFAGSNAALESLREISDDWLYASPFFNPEFDYSLEVMLARNYAALEQPEQTIELYRAAIDRYYSWLTPRIELGWYYEGQGDIEAARTEFITALGLTEDDELRAEIQQWIVELGPAPAN